ncbi:TetR family transcriptional regulator [Marinobacterium halophilum]|uniref:TetR family transcriptional regulator n=1 Tax=Marinobacterium halophilum TaxID=267374 RepID=A0A2P8EZQ0_9GAMM|nr:TetR/AcrR family transcriptional regulator [Marinobacterium halophilum]PSL14942.1 TetR family transcriptional regulator [Marinobacterium halophilum]
MDKREQLVSVAFDLFYRHGVHAVGINRVLAESGIAKKTLYHYFPSKDELVAATVSYRDHGFVQWLQQRLDLAEGYEAVMALFDALDDWFNGRDPSIQPFYGCFFINVSAEFGNPEHPVHQQCAAHKQQLAALIRQRLESMPKYAADSLIDALLLLKEGAIVQASVAGDLEAGLKAKAVAQRLFSLANV